MDQADIHNFSTSPSQHRLPTVTGVEALQNSAAKARGIPTSLPTLDTILLNHPSPGLLAATPGIQRGHVTEVFGPPGVGKTAFGLQIALNAVQSQQECHHVLWVNTGSPLVETRLEELMSSYSFPPTSDLPSSPPETIDTRSCLDERFTYLDAHTLPRLLTVFLHPPASLPSSKTSLIVVDDLSNLLLGALSRRPKDPKPSAPAIVNEKLEKQATSIRFQVIESLATSMSKMAAIRKIAILVLTNTAMSLRDSNRALLKPGLSSQAWESAIHTRIMLYRDFADKDQRAAMPGAGLGLRYAEVQRIARKDVFTWPVPFVISSAGLHELALNARFDQVRRPAESGGTAELVQVSLPDDLPLLPVDLSQPSPIQSPANFKKRKAFEIADSEEEDEGDDAASSGADEPALPRMDLVPRGEVDEMILETHETALLRRERYSKIKGSEDEIPALSSDVDEAAEAP